jgi:hypothetical protein
MARACGSAPLPVERRHATDNWSPHRPYVSDYTPLGIQKIAQQVGLDPTTVRCPRDSVVMRVLVAKAERPNAEGVTRRTFEGLPKGTAWQLTEVDVECPACRRSATGIRPMKRSSVAREPAAR